MASPETEQLQVYIDELINKTREGAFQWESVNPTTFVWQKTDPNGHGARLSLQRILVRTAGVIARSTAPPVHYLLQVTEVTSLGTTAERLKINGQSDPELDEKLKELFRLIRSGITKQGLDFFKNVIETP
jgi:hypothetical protein